MFAFATLAGCSQTIGLPRDQLVALGRGDTIALRDGQRVDRNDLERLRIYAAPPRVFVTEAEGETRLTEPDDHAADGVDTITLFGPTKVRVEEGTLAARTSRRQLEADLSGISSVDATFRPPLPAGIGMVVGGSVLTALGVLGGTALAIEASQAEGGLFPCYMSSSCRDSNAASVLLGMLSTTVFAAGLGPGVPLVVLGGIKIHKATQFGP